jgi:hypothetical protein
VLMSVGSGGCHKGRISINGRPVSRQAGENFIHVEGISASVSLL